VSEQSSSPRSDSEREYSNYGELTSERSSATIASVWYGFPTKQLFDGSSQGRSHNFPETMRIFMGGQHSRTVWASSSPSMLPGMSISVNNTEISSRNSSRATASSALPASGREACFLDNANSKHSQQRIVLHD
jgi:hypothetical protein